MDQHNYNINETHTFFGGVVSAAIISLLLYTRGIKNGPVGSSSHINNQRATINLRGGPNDVVWIVQFSDLHFSVHHPKRALDFKNLVPPTLSMIKPSLVLITDDLTELQGSCESI
ncbi:Metallophos domain-containing protein [Heracleum sosnowskyi]|uniref:Metallophos domain-containing protein n=1 Tax=Heracleum sosnowskyi TaxID=360622 RepID=A0AAD8HZL8_9APIA|nr:Metallophos domain-containing protein [Heracleum sosnowskyi]